MKKICKTCGKTLSLSYFHKDKNGKMGVRGSCKNCTKAGKDHEKIAKRMNDYYIDMKISGDIRYWNKRAKTSNERALKMFNISTKITGKELINKFKESNKCAYCDAPLTHLSAEIEHMISLANNGLHNIENITFTCHDCNAIKRSNSEYDFFKYIESIYNKLKHKYS